MIQFNLVGVDTIDRFCSAWTHLFQVCNEHWWDGCIMGDTFWMENGKTRLKNKINTTFLIGKA